MRYKVVFSTLFSLLMGTANANWTKINEADYNWGPFNIYHISLFTETGKYEPNNRPLMLTLQYKKPWEGRDFVVSLARTWKNLGITLPEKETDEVLTHLRKIFPDIKPEDTLHYIALEDHGYFILNDRVIPQTFDKAFNDAIVAIWLDPKMDISRQLLDPSYKPEEKIDAKFSEQKEPENVLSQAEIVEEPVIQGNEKTPLENKAEEPKIEAKTTNVTADSQKAEPQVKEAEATPPENIEAQSNEKTKEVKVAEEPVKPTPKPQEEKKTLNSDNPEIFISPIYDDILMLSKSYI